MSFVSARLAALGIAPAGDSGYVQLVPMVERRVAASTVLEVVTPTASRRLRTGDELAPLLSLGAGMPPPRLTASGPVVFAGYAIDSRARNALSGFDAAAGEEVPGDALDALPLAGSVVVAVMGAPPTAGAALRAHFDAPEQVASRLQRLLAARPAAVVLLFPAHLDATYQALRQMGDVAMSLESGERTPPGQRLLPPVFVGPAVAGSPLLPSGWPLNDAPGALEGHRFRADVVEAAVARPTYNVVGVLRGADPRLAGRMVALGAGGPWEAGGSTTVASHARGRGPGTDDGSGVVMLLAAARVLAAGPASARSVLFLIHPGGASAQSGVAWFVRDSTASADSIDLMLAPVQLARGTGDSIVVAATNRVPTGVGGAAHRRLGRIDRLAVVDSVNATLAHPLAIVPWLGADAPRTSLTPSLWPWVRSGVPVLRLSAPSAVGWLPGGTANARAMTGPAALLVQLVRAFADDDGGGRPPRP